MASQKTTQPFNKQAAELLLLSLFFPGFGASYSSKIKPQMFEQLFGKGGREAFKDFQFGEDFSNPISPFAALTNYYSPFNFLASNPFGRPGGPSPEEIRLLSNSFFGSVAPLNLGPLAAPYGGMAGLTQGALSALAPFIQGGGLTGAGFLPEKGPYKS